MFIPISLFVAQTSSSDFLEKNRDLSELLANSFDTVWQNTLDSPLFVRISFLGAVCAVIALAIFGYQWLEFTTGQRGYLDCSKIIIPVLLVILLSKPVNQPILLAQALLGLRNLGNNISTGLLDSLSSDLTASAAADIAAAKTMMQLITADAVQTCAAITERDVRNDCFIDAEAQVVKLVNQYRPSLVAENWATRLGRQSIRKIQDAVGADYATSQWFGRLFGSLGGAYQVASNFATPILFLSIGYAFYWVLELIALLTALTSPLFLGMSLYSPRHEPFVRSMSMFGGVWLAEFSYSVIIGFTGLLMSKTESDPVLLFPLIAGVFGPLLAFSMGTGGGLSLFSVFTGAAAFSLKGR